jgi:hypothetical protein
VAVLGEAAMGLLIIRHKVKDYSKWRPQFKVTSPRHVRFTPNNGRKVSILAVRL